MATLAILALLAWGLPRLLDWALWQAVWAPDVDACQAARGHGACWGVVAEKHRLILFGRYPFKEQWRPAAALALWIALGAWSLARAGRPGGGRVLPWAWIAGLLGGVLLLRGGFAGLPFVPTEQWGGLPLTLLLALVAIGLAFPLAIALALARRSGPPLLRGLSTLYIELIRGVPLVSVLFMASFIFPLLLPPGSNPDVLLRVLAGLALFAAAYLAEAVRAGLQAVPLAQAQAARSLGLTAWQVQRLVLLPQALRAALPALLNSFISTFKDSSLVTIVSLYELTGALGLALSGDPVWRPFKVEGYLFITAIYFIGCAAMSAGGRWAEARWRRGN
ncbi:amino acid ABC transporter permease [Azohydromonas aeria]|uniref:amino acid ABC transporter permease n=1 Tax=Azohydromonas aeria TaxID=2590212 RepID=UPI001E423345|nr:ABC transporter permease subunit [Azohydromonas aeria]